MATKKLNKITDIKSLEDLRQLKLKKKYEVDLKRLELQSSLIRVQMHLDPDNIKETIVTEARFYAQDLAVKYLPGFVLNFFLKNK